MTYEKWERVKEECHNDKLVAFVGLSKEAQEAMREAAEISGFIEILDVYGAWSWRASAEFLPGKPYRVSPSWPGPAKPEPVVEYEDVPVYDHGGNLFYEPETESRERVSDATGRTDFAGYVMSDGNISRKLIFDAQKDNTYRLRVPKAVRLVKEVAK